MVRILFIYGYGGSPKSKFCELIRAALPTDKFEVVSYAYPQEDCTQARIFLQKIIEREKIDLVLGTSLGGFITLTLDTILPKIVLNPCMLPSKELPLLLPRVDHPEDVLPSREMIETYKPFEALVNNGYNNRSSRVIGLFADEDELLGTKYKQSFMDVYDEVRSMPGGHHGNAAAIPAIVKAIQDIMTPVLSFDPEHWPKSDHSRAGEVVIRILEGGNKYMKPGDSRCGVTPGLQLGVPIYITFPDGSSYRGGVIESIDWEEETFCTAQSKYAFHFVVR